MVAKSLATSEQREPATSISIFQSTRNMLPYYIAAGHNQYAKRTRMSLQLFDAWSQQCPDLMDEVFGKGHHTVRYLSRNWSGTGSDMSIEESVMREAKTSGVGQGNDVVLRPKIGKTVINPIPLPMNSIRAPETPLSLFAL